MSNKTINAIETIYKGYRFRSRTEARWAVFFDAVNIKYMYEPEGFELSDGTKYLPDFYLPETDTFFECKGIMSEYDSHKINQFQKDTGKDVAIGYSDMTFQASDAFAISCFSISGKQDSSIAECSFCGAIQFIGLNGAYVCRHCGKYDKYLAWQNAFGDGKRKIENKKIADAITKAKQARFEHGEVGA